MNPSNVNQHTANPEFEFAALEAARNYRRFLIQTFRPFLHGEVLELGAGIGQFSQELAGEPSISNLHLLEPDTRFHGRLQQSVPNARLIGGITSGLLEDASFDTLVSVNVLEHIEDDAGELVHYFRLLKPGGHLCLYVPACPCLHAPIDDDFGHFRRYHRRRLASLLDQAGFRSPRLSYSNIAGFFGWYVNFKLLKKRSFEVRKVWLFDRLIFPPFRLVEQLCPPPFGQNLLVIAEKESAPRTSR